MQHVFALDSIAIQRKNVLSNAKTCYPTQKRAIQRKNVLINTKTTGAAPFMLMLMLSVFLGGSSQNGQEWAWATMSMGKNKKVLCAPIYILLMPILAVLLIIWGVTPRMGTNGAALQLQWSDLVAWLEVLTCVGMLIVFMTKQLSSTLIVKVVGKNIVSGACMNISLSFFLSLLQYSKRKQCNVLCNAKMCYPTWKHIIPRDKCVI